ncbi:MAG TPA: PspC domain-containing protein [Euzebyales bacterium]
MERTPCIDPTTDPAIATQTEPTSTRRGVGLWRSHDRRVIAGIAGGLSERFGIDPVYVRASFVALGMAGGFGVFAYLLLWTAADQERPPDAVVRRARPRHDLGTLSIVLGIMLMLRSTGIWLGDGVVWPVALVALGSSVIWSRNDDGGAWNRFASAATNAESPGRTGLVRLALGGVLVVAGVGIFIAGSSALPQTGGAVVAVVITGLGVGLILGPWMVRQAQQLTQERHERIRSQERAEVAAHLHDSVLQTLAMIQRSDSSRRMISLARSQERELRAWLYGADDQQADRLQPMFEDVAARIEQRYDLPVELVVVGDMLVDDQVRALSAAAYEALQNAARHSQADTVSMYVEVEPAHVTVFVRDEGKGFDPRAIPDDRRGIDESIRGRMSRHGGVATVRSEPGSGTEIELQLPREHTR